MRVVVPWSPSAFVSSAVTRHLWSDGVLSGIDSCPCVLYFPRTETQEDLQKLPPGFPRGAVPQPPFPPLSPTMGQMHTLMPAQSLQPTQQLEYKVRLIGSLYPSILLLVLVWAGLQGAAASAEQLRLPSSFCPPLPGGSLCVPRSLMLCLN